MEAERLARADLEEAEAGQREPEPEPEPEPEAQAEAHDHKQVQRLQRPCRAVRLGDWAMEPCILAIHPGQMARRAETRRALSMSTRCVR